MYCAKRVSGDSIWAEAGMTVLATLVTTEVAEKVARQAQARCYARKVCSDPIAHDAAVL